MKFIASCLSKKNMIVIDKEAGGDPLDDDSDIEQDKIEINVPTLAPKIHKLSLITPKRVEPRAGSQRTAISNSQVVEISDSEDCIIETINPNKPADPEGDRVEFRPFKRRLIKVANKCKIEGRDYSMTECSICLSSLEFKPQLQIGKLSCNHAFCFQCIRESSSFSNKCPYCRASFNCIRRGQQLVHVQEKHRNQEEDFNEQPCYVCGRNDDFDHLLECEYCEGAFCHTYCDSRLENDEPPEASWFCLSCSEVLERQAELSRSR